MQNDESIVYLSQMYKRLKDIASDHPLCSLCCCGHPLFHLLTCWITKTADLWRRASSQHWLPSVLTACPSKSCRHSSLLTIRQPIYMFPSLFSFTTWLHGERSSWSYLYRVLLQFFWQRCSVTALRSPAGKSAFVSELRPLSSHSTLTGHRVWINRLMVY